eukprot:1153895-Pelagomonas_calceolata.AAC.7
MGTEIPARACSIKGQVRTQENKNCTREKQNNGQGPNKDKQGDGHFRLWRVSTDECRRQAWVHLNLKQQWRALLAEHDGRQAAHVIKRILGTKEASVGASEVEAAMTSLREGGGSGGVLSLWGGKKGPLVLLPPESCNNGLLYHCAYPQRGQ